jgi:hypothetical protein
MMLPEAARPRQSTHKDEESTSSLEQRSWRWTVMGASVISNSSWMHLTIGGQVRWWCKMRTKMKFLRTIVLALG